MKKITIDEQFAIASVTTLLLFIFPASKAFAQGADVVVGDAASGFHESPITFPNKLPMLKVIPFVEQWSFGVKSQIDTHPANFVEGAEPRSKGILQLQPYRISSAAPRYANYGVRDYFGEGTDYFGEDIKALKALQDNSSSVGLSNSNGRVDPRYANYAGEPKAQEDNPFQTPPRKVGGVDPRYANYAGEPKAQEDNPLRSMPHRIGSVDPRYANFVEVKETGEQLIEQTVEKMIKDNPLSVELLNSNSRVDPRYANYVGEPKAQEGNSFQPLPRKVGGVDPRYAEGTDFYGAGIKVLKDMNDENKKQPQPQPSPTTTPEPQKK